MEKHAACAAATSSSGLVPRSFSNRILNVYGTFESTPVPVDTVPRPSWSPPVHAALALRFIVSPFEIFGKGKGSRNDPGCDRIVFLALVER
jgi:hypothetical protein